MTPDLYWAGRELDSERVVGRVFRPSGRKLGSWTPSEWWSDYPWGGEGRPPKKAEQRAVGRMPFELLGDILDSALRMSDDFPALYGSGRSMVESADIKRPMSNTGAERQRFKVSDPSERYYEATRRWRDRKREPQAMSEWARWNHELRASSYPPSNGTAGSDGDRAP